VPEAVSRIEALRVLALSSTADRDDVKRAYRRLAQEHHPDRGGDPDTFHEIARAYERLLRDDTRPTVPTVTPGRPSRTVTADRDEPTADLATVDWTVSSPAVGTRLDRDRMAVALTAGPGVPVAPLTAVSRAPGSRLNGLAPYLAEHATAELAVDLDTDDRGRAIVAVELRAWARRGRRTLDAADLLGRWTRIRGSSHTLLRSTFPPVEEARTCAVVATDRAEELLESLSWGLPAWTLTQPVG
jgi:hypothetical protein